MKVTESNLSTAAGNALLILRLYIASLQENGPALETRKRLIEITAGVLASTVNEVFSGPDPDLLTIIGEATQTEPDKNNLKLENLRRQLNTLKEKYPEDDPRFKTCALTNLFLDAIRGKTNTHYLLEIVTYGAADAMDPENINFDSMEKVVRDAARKGLPANEILKDKEPV